MEFTATSDGYRWKKLGPVSAHEQPPPMRHEEFEDGHASGYAEGFREGELKAASEQQVVLERLKNVLSEVERLRDRTINDGLQDIAVALHLIFKQVFLYELRTAPELMQALAAELRSVLQAQATPTIVLSRKDYTALSALDVAQLQGCLDVDDDLPEGVLRASAGKSMLELDIVANLEQVLASAVLSMQEAMQEATQGASHE